MIIQGTNVPLTVIFDEDVSSVPVLYITLWRGDEELKRWDRSTISVQEDTAVLPLTQEETASFPAGEATLEVKGLTPFGQTVFWEECSVDIYPRRDREIQITRSGG